jgi:hypothetical protein
MPAFAGTSLKVNWIWASGTLAMDGDYRTFTYTPSIDLFDQTAGADTSRSFVNSYKAGEASFAGLLQSGSAPAWGSALVEGNAGTIIYYPEGTANGNWRGTVPAISLGMAQNLQYNALVETSVSWTQNGARTEGTA